MPAPKKRDDNDIYQPDEPGVIYIPLSPPYDMPPKKKPPKREFGDEFDKAGFSEDQPRDEHGRWSSEGGGGEGGNISGEQRPSGGKEEFPEKDPAGWPKSARIITTTGEDGSKQDFVMYRNPNFEHPTGLSRTLYHDTNLKALPSIQKEGLKQSPSPGQAPAVWHNGTEAFFQTPGGFLEKDNVTIKSQVPEDFIRDEGEQGIETGNIPMKYIQGYLRPK